MREEGARRGAVGGRSLTNGTVLVKCVLDERAAAAFPASPSFHRALADPTLLASIVRAAERFNYAVV